MDLDLISTMGEIRVHGEIIVFIEDIVTEIQFGVDCSLVLYRDMCRTSFWPQKLYVCTMTNILER